MKGFKKLGKMIGVIAMAAALLAGADKSGIMMGSSITAEAATVVKSAKCGDNVKWTLDSDGIITVSGTGAMYDAPDDKVYDYTLPVRDEKVAKVVIQPGVTTIGAYFMTYATDVTSVEIPSTVTKIGKYAFAYASVKKLDLPDSIKRIEDYALVNYFLRFKNAAVYLPRNLEYVGKYAFAATSDNEAYFTAVLPEGIKTVEKGAFYLYHNMTLAVPDTINALGGKNWIAEYAGYNNSLVMAVADSEHAKYTKLESNKPQNITIEGDFRGLTNVSGSVDLKASSPQLGGKLSYSSSNVKIATVNSSGIVSIQGTGKVMITVSAAATSAYSAGTRQVELEIKEAPAGSAFTSGKLMYKITKTGSEVSVTGVTDKTLTSATIPASIIMGGVSYNVTEITTSAVKNCKKLKKVTIGSNVTKIGKIAFYKDSALETVTIKSKKLTSIGKNAFTGIASGAIITVPGTKTSAYKTMLKETGMASSVKIKSN